MSKINDVGSPRYVGLSKNNKITKTNNQSERVEINDLKNMASATVGRSQVGRTDSVDNDIKFFISNPNKVMTANAFFDKTYEALKTEKYENSYEKSSQLMNAFKEEFLSK